MNQTGIKLNSEWMSRDLCLCSQSLALVLTNQNNQVTEHVQNTNQWNPQNGHNKQQYKTLQRPRLRERTDRAWFSRLLRHPVRKQSGSLFLQPRRPHGATKHRQVNNLGPTNSIVYTETDNTWFLVRKQKPSYWQKNHVTLVLILKSVFNNT